MEDKTVPVKSADTLTVICPTCSARYNLPKYVEGQRYGCKRCSASLMFGKFALLQELGRGGFGVVYKAWQADLQRVVALKFLHSDNEESTERFIREARIAANLNHPNITAIYEVGTHEGKLYITMQFVDGITTNKADFGIREAVQVMRDASLAVDYAHARDIIHRDIKPHNIMVTEERSGTSTEQMSRRTFVMDFGLARSVARGGTLTTEGQVMGTPAYMSPEQAEGKTCDTRSDVYSLGATLYALVTKRAPFEHQTPLQVLMQVTRGNPTPPSQVNAEIDKNLEAVILKAMAVEPAQRYPTAARLAADLTSWLAGGVTDAAPTLHLSASSKTSRAVRRRNRGVMVAVGIALILTGAAGLAYQFYPRSNGTPPVTPPTHGGTAVNGGAAVTPVPPAAPIVLLDARTQPPGARLRIGNREWTTPAALTNRDIGEGTHEIEIHQLGYKTVRETITLKAGPAPLSREWPLEKDVRAVAFRIESTPPGARVSINRRDLGAVTPHVVYRDEIDGAVAQIELELEGFQTGQRSMEVTGVPQVVPIQLSPRTGTFDVTAAAARATLHLFVLPPGLKNPRWVTALWSENADSLEQAVAALDVADAAFVTDRLKELAERADPKLRDRLKRLAATPPSPTGVRPDRTLTADGLGRATIDNAWVVKRYRLFATSPFTTDYLTDEVEPRYKQETAIRVEMIRVGTLSAAGLRPSIGQFRIQYADGSSPGKLVPGGPPVRVNSGPVTLRFLPGPEEPALKEFAIQTELKDRFDLAGSLFVLAGDTYEKDSNIPQAMRAYTRMLEEMNFPASDEPERARVAEKARAVYRAWVDALPSKSMSGDLSARVAEMRLKEPAEAAPLLLDLYAAREADRPVKSAAASALALAHARLKQPYEAVEWIERCVKNAFDPGAESEGAVAIAIRKLPGLPERWTAAVQSIAAMRKAAARKPASLGVKVSEVAGKGLRIEAIAKGSAAERGGFQLGDVLTDMGGNPLKAEKDLTAAIGALAAGDEVEIQFERGGEKIKGKPKLGPVPPQEPEWITAVAPPPPPPAVAKVGVVQLVHKTLGVIVKLDPGVAPQKQDVLDLYRNGEKVGELIVEDLPGPEGTYPNGSVRSKNTTGLILKGDEARKRK